jgi:catechol 2,3-dioxygenase-like lactoylglutathione lyase family enzyme
MKPKPHKGLRHIALFIKNFDACITFYRDLLGMKIEWQPDENNVYLTSGNDNLALHRAKDSFKPDLSQHLDHFGFILETPEEVDVWYNYLKENQVVIKALPKDHRDGARSFYCCDPEGNLIQIIYHPPIAKT